MTSAPDAPPSVASLFPPLRLGTTLITPPLLLAPLAGITNSAFRRLLSDFGGYGALTTEMLSASAFLHEAIHTSPWTRRRPCEGPVIYQFRTSGDEHLERVVARVLELEPTALDINLGCPAPEIQQQASGAALWRDFPRLRATLERIRRVYAGPLTVKCRLGDDPETWQPAFLERLHLFESLGIDALTVHPRFSGEKLKRRVRWEVFPWITAQTTLPVMGNGDLASPAEVLAHRDWFAPLAGLMLGRIAVVKPWIFREFAGLPSLPVDFSDLWHRMRVYTEEDMPPAKAFGRLMEFTHYFGMNFLFGHDLQRASRGVKGKDLDALEAAVMAFLAKNPTQRQGSPLAWL